MAVINNLRALSGEDRDLYVRLIALESVPNNQPDGTLSVPAAAVFRGFISQDAFKDGGNFVWERTVEFVPKFRGDIRKEAYAALKAQPDFADAVEA